MDLKTVWSLLPGSMKAFVRRLPVFADLAAARRRCVELEAELATARGAPAAPGAAPHLLFPPGHFYSPLPDIEDIERRAGIVFAPPPRTLPAIDLREAEQLALLASHLPPLEEEGGATRCTAQLPAPWPRPSSIGCPGERVRLPGGAEHGRARLVAGSFTGGRGPSVRASLSRPRRGWRRREAGAALRT